MGKRLYVGNLNFAVSDQHLHEAFSQVGHVESVKVVVDRDTGRSKGFAFVEMSTDEEAQAAISRFNGTDFQGRNMNVSEARPQENRGDGGFRSGGGGGPRGGGPRGHGGGGGGNRRFGRP